jgi:hypothetical protein
MKAGVTTPATEAYESLLEWMSPADGKRSASSEEGWDVDSMATAGLVSRGQCCDSSLDLQRPDEPSQRCTAPHATGAGRPCLHGHTDSLFCPAQLPPALDGRSTSPGLTRQADGLDSGAQPACDTDHVYHIERA